MLSSFLNQSAQYRELTGQNNRGEPIYADMAVISCRAEHKTQEIITSDGRTVRAAHVYYVTHTVREGDLLDDMRVQLVTDMVSLNGVVEGYKAVI